MIRLVLVAVLLMSSLTTLAEDPSPKELPTGHELEAIGSAEKMGLTIYRHDHAAAVATDAALKLRAFKKDRRVKGWITQEQQDQIVVSFIDRKPAALYRIVVSNDGVAGPVEVLKSPTALTEYESGAAAARSAALATNFERCSKNYNSVVLPIAETSEKKWLVYLLPGTTKDHVIPLGGTFRFEIDGAKVIAQRGFTRSCIALESKPGAVALMITHLMDPVPTEVHVFWSLWGKTSMFVGTTSNGNVWGVEGNKIVLLKRKAAED